MKAGQRVASFAHCCIYLQPMQCTGRNFLAWLRIEGSFSSFSRLKKFEYPARPSRSCHKYISVSITTINTYHTLLVLLRLLLRSNPTLNHSDIPWPQHGSIRVVAIYNIVHHSHSPGVMELNVEQLAHLQLVALSGRSYGCGGWDKCEKTERLWELVEERTN